MKEFLRGVVKVNSASSQQVVAEPKARKKSRRPQIFATLFAAMNNLLLRKGGTEQVRQVLSGSKAVLIFAACDVCLAHRLLAVFREKSLSPLFLSGTASLQSVPSSCED